jgi:AhpD family alkylhydroperoxidase
MRLGVDEIGVTELMAVAEHTRSMTALARGLVVLPDIPDRPPGRPALVALANPETTDEPGRSLFGEISAFAKTALGMERVPNLWRAIGNNPHYLESTWRKDQVVMAAGKLPARDKRLVALGVAMNGGCTYLIEYHAAILHRTGCTDHDLLEVMGVVDHYNSLNTLSEGMQIGSDIKPPA